MGSSVAADHGTTPHTADVQRQVAVQRAGDFVVDGLAVTGADAVAGAANTFVAPRGATAVTATATVTSASGAVLPGNAVQWSGGRAGGSQLERVVPGRPGRLQLRARVGGSSRLVTIFITDVAAPPAAIPAAVLQHRKIGASTPGTAFGLTVVTIGSQGVKGPAFRVAAFFAGGQWRFGVNRISHGYKLAIHSLGRTDIPNARAVPARRAGPIITDLTPFVATSGPPRVHFWVRSFTLAHENAHVDHFYNPAFGFWPTSVNAFETTVSGLSVPFDPATARTSAQVMAAQRAGWRTAIDGQHNSADAAEIGSAEAHCHGVVSNPMYTALIADIRATVRPPNPTGVRVTATAADSVALAWAQDATLANGFQVERRTGAGPFVVVAAGLPVGALTFADAGLSADTRFTYRVRALGAAGGSSGATARARTTR